MSRNPLSIVDSSVEVRFARADCLAICADGRIISIDGDRAGGRHLLLGGEPGNPERVFVMAARAHTALSRGVLIYAEVDGREFRSERDAQAKP